MFVEDLKLLINFAEKSQEEEKVEKAKMEEEDWDILLEEEIKGFPFEKGSEEEEEEKEEREEGEVEEVVFLK